MSSNPETTRKLIYSILQFLQTSLDNGTVRSDDKEGVEVAVQCIGEAFDVSPTDASLSTDKPLDQIFAAHLSTSTTSSKPAASSSSSAPPPKAPSAADVAEAEKLKSQGNQQMSSKNYQGAITAYTSAIGLNPTNPVYFSNRAAAYSSLGDHEHAAEDAESALAVDAKFAKAYSRLGHARYSMKQYSAAADAFRKGLELDPGNANMKTGLENAEARVGEEEVEEEDPRQSAATDRATGAGAGAGAGGAGGFDFSRAAEMLQGMGGGRGGGAGGGGMPDLAGLMNNPQVMQAAQQMMQNGGLEQLMNNPMMRNLAQQFMQGQGRGGGSA